MNRTKRTEAEQQALLEYIRERYVYDATTGSIRHKGKEKALKGRLNKDRGYLQIAVFFKRKQIFILMQYAVWAVCKCRWPVGTIDHIDGNPTNNRIENLRECSLGENRLNMLLPWMPNEKTGVPGVRLQGLKYRCRIRGKSLDFTSPYEAFFTATLCGKRYRQD